MTATRTTVPARAGTVVATLLRLVLGGFWIEEGVFKLTAGFGRDDILLVVQSVQHNARVPDLYRSLVTDGLLARLPDLFGVGVPLVEVGLGVVLVLGVVTAPAAIASTITLASYWLADQLIGQYPVMIVLSALVLAAGPAAARWGLATRILRGRRVPAAVRRWL
jgi:thiosulfate dehydrogenase (quinone) large subunit